MAEALRTTLEIAAASVEEDEKTLCQPNEDFMMSAVILLDSSYMGYIAHVLLDSSFVCNITQNRSTWGWLGATTYCMAPL